MTIKPQNGTTSTTMKPSNTTEALLLIGNDNAPLAEFESTTKLIENNVPISTTQKEVITTAMATNISSSTVATTISVAADALPHNMTLQALPSADNYTATTTTTDCKKGFYRNNKGNCELKLQSPSNM